LARHCVCSAEGHQQVYLTKQTGCTWISAVCAGTSMAERGELEMLNSRRRTTIDTAHSKQMGHRMSLEQVPFKHLVPGSTPWRLTGKPAEKRVSYCQMCDQVFFDTWYYSELSMNPHNSTVLSHCQTWQPVGRPISLVYLNCRSLARGLTTAAEVVQE
jgi:hypothetical protein